MADGKPVGVLTTVASDAVNGELLALGFIRREALERGMPLEYAGGFAEAREPSIASKA